MVAIYSGYSSVANVPEAEEQFQASEFLDVTVQPKPIYISPNEVYAMHSMLSTQLDHIVRLPALCSVLVVLTRSVGVSDRRPQRHFKDYSN